MAFYSSLRILSPGQQRQSDNGFPPSLTEGGDGVICGGVSCDMYLRSYDSDHTLSNDGRMTLT
ncbi:hypothetical protein E2C01_085937 [Portunus trituberculatus]|uniref:Uncharacterized protein n=1 Tax=Portunus trituberculatus TaxID=210409 RepID=A0A5B7J8X8_PORTR|nr:hypothetical protein [Portunus trituberculatus]